MLTFVRSGLTDPSISLSERITCVDSLNPLYFGNLLISAEEERDLILDSKTLSADFKLSISSLLAGSKSSNFLSFSDRRESAVYSRDFAGRKLCLLKQRDTLLLYLIDIDTCY